VECRGLTVISTGSAGRITTPALGIVNKIIQNIIAFGLTVISTGSAGRITTPALDIVNKIIQYIIAFESTGDKKVQRFKAILY
jgi:DNA topoisomerase IA